MSGILGVWNSQKLTPWHKMLADLEVLGCDAQGDWHDLELGLSLGRTQFYNTPESCYEAPVVTFEGCVLVWDGRLDERESLLSGRPSNITDAQLIIESYRRWGENCLCHLVGEFVFILWDAPNDLLFVGCDVLGERTVAYYWDGQTLLLSSRVLTLLLHPQVNKQLDELYLVHTLCDLWIQPPGLTPFASIQRLRPGFALILKSGQFQQRRIAQLATPKRYESPKSPEVYCDSFWELFNRSVKDRLRSHRPVVTTLSGGLDSTTVTVALLNHLPTVDAFSFVTEVFPEFDERKPIQSFLQRYPQVRWHPLNCDQAWSLTEPWEQLPVTDDPSTGCTLAAELQLMEQMQKLGFGLVFDGDGGDELFNESLKELARAGNWRIVFQILRTKKRSFSTLWQELVLPRLPRYWQSKWVARVKRKSQLIPPWITHVYAEKPHTQEALQRYFEATMLSSGFVEDLTVVHEGSSFVGTTQLYRLLTYAYGMESASPLLDQRLVEFVLHLPPVLQTECVHEKVFLRQVNRSYLPEEVLWRPKENYFDPLRDTALAKGHQAVELLGQILNCSCLQEIIDTKQVETYLNGYRQGQSLTNNHELFALLTFVNWYQRVDRQYGL